MKRSCSLEWPWIKEENTCNTLFSKDNFNKTRKKRWKVWKGNSQKKLKEPINQWEILALTSKQVKWMHKPTWDVISKATCLQCYSHPLSETLLFVVSKGECRLMATHYRQNTEMPRIQPWAGHFYNLLEGSRNSAEESGGKKELGWRDGSALRALIALLKVLNLIPNNHMAVHKHLILPSGVQMYMQTKHPYN